MIRYLFLYYYDFYLFCSMVYFKILTKWEAQILIYLLLTVWQKSLNVPLFCMQISIPAFRASYSSLHCVGDKSTGEAKALSFGKKLAEFYISLHKFQDSPTHIYSFCFWTVYAWTRSSGLLLPVVVTCSSANQNITHSYQALLSTPILEQLFCLWWVI